MWILKIRTGSSDVFFSQARTSKQKLLIYCEVRKVFIDLCHNVTVWGLNVCRKSSEQWLQEKKRGIGQEEKGKQEKGSGESQRA